MKRPFQKDILTKIRFKKEPKKAVYKDMRNSAGDFPILNVAVSETDSRWKIAVGARPSRAQVAREASSYLDRQKEAKGCLTETDIEQAAQMASLELTFGSNMRGSAEYRRAVCKALVKRAILEVEPCK